MNRVDVKGARPLMRLKPRPQGPAKPNHERMAHQLAREASLDKCPECGIEVSPELPEDFQP